MKLVKERKLCMNCLRPNHFVSQCTSESTCKQCGEKHHSFLHFDRSAIKSPEPTQTVVSAHVANNNQSQVLLATAMVLVQDTYGNLQQCRALLDPGSQASFVTKSCVQRLKLQRHHVDVDISGLAATEIANARHYTNLHIVSNVNACFTFNVEAYNLARVTGLLPNLPCDSAPWHHVTTLQLADPIFNQPGHVDILLGADVVSDVMLGEVRHGPENSPIAQDTKLGWILYGRAASPTASTKPASTLFSCTTQLSLDKSLQRFWQLEDLPMKRLLTAEEQTCEGKFSLTHTRNSDGRYVVRLPFKPGVSLGNSYNMALRRFKSVECKLEANPELKLQYHKFMQDYLDLGHMQRVPSSYPQKRDNAKFYLPHHCVFKASSTTTKLRVVFDGSARSTSGNSLNDLLMVGPVIQDDLISILLRFRLHLIALIADVVKMYRQVLINSDHIDYQRILWRFSPSKPIEEFQLLTVTYGTASAPYLATKALLQLADDEQHSFPIASEIIKRDFYVDDLMSGAESVTSALQLQTQLIQMTEAGGFRLQKWASNSHEVLEAVPPELRGTNLPLTIDVDESIRTLGLLWNPSTDSFHFSVESFRGDKLTKRIILSDIARIFDPLGWLCCVTIIPKILMQRLWQINADWDEDIPNGFIDEFLTYRKDLEQLQDVIIPRCIIQPHVNRRELHGFSDASEKAFAALVYLRTIDSSGAVKMNLLASKTKVAPLKQVTLPRLELCGAVLLSRLITSTVASLHLTFDGVFAWSDSKTALAWIEAPPQRWKTFIANRVAEIQDCVPTPQWYHIAGKENPADLATRGIYPSELSECSFWWNGPSTFQLNSWEPPKFKSNKTTIEEALIEERKTVTVSVCTIDLSILAKYSSLTELKRITALLLRFPNNLRKVHSQRLLGVLSVEELQYALFALIKQVQQVYFADEIKSLQTKSDLSDKSKLKSLLPFIAENGLLRVGGRLQNAILPYNQKHPIILPAHSLLTTLIVKHVHFTHLHAGPSLMLQIIRETYWILNVKNVVKFFYKRCITCYRQFANSSSQIMANLPASRVTPAQPFANCGVDFAGPFMLKAIKGRGNQRYKAYVSLFVCFCTRAIHLELVSDLSTPAFIAALKRFISRRGKPSVIHSDCGTNFVGANKELKVLRTLFKEDKHNKLISNYLSKDEIKWQFNPPAAPHFGGLWEAGVKSTKYHLRRIVGNEVLNFEEMATVLCQVEAVLNSRPLCPISSDPNDFTALTPGHFLIGQALTSIPEPSYTDLKINRLSRWQLTQQLIQHFWNRWSSEYLSRLQQRPKWFKYQPNIEKDALVLLKDERLPPLQWKLGRVVDTHPGSDGKTRVVSIKTEDGEFKRPIAKICLLPIEASQSSMDQ